MPVCPAIVEPVSDPMEMICERKPGFVREILIFDPLEHFVTASGMDPFVRLFRRVVVDVVDRLLLHGNGDGAENALGGF